VVCVSITACGVSKEWLFRAINPPRAQGRTAAIGNSGTGDQVKSLSKSVLWRAASPVVMFVAVTTSATGVTGATARAETIDIGEIVVTPNRTKSDKAKVGSVVDTVSKKDIAAQHLPTVQEFLAQEPGVNVASQGGDGQETTLVVRGADKKYVKTLWNGIDISDTAATQVQVSPEHLLTNGVQSIEVLKGSQSTLYGADAVAGVIGISTLGDFDEGIRYIVSGEAGSFGTFRGSAGVQAGSADGSRFAANVTGLTTDGISAADRRNGNTERDGYDNVTISLAGEKVLDQYLTAFGSLLYVDNRTEYDDSVAGVVFDNAYNHAERRQLAGRAGLTATSLDGRLRNTVSIQINDVDRHLSSTTFGPVPFDIDFASLRQKGDWLMEYELNDQITLQAGADYERQSFSNGFSSNEVWIAGGWGQIIYTPVENLTLTGAVRHDEHDEFGGFTTWRTTAAYLFADTGTKVRGSAGTGFRSPSPFELGYVSFVSGTNNPNLKPEESFSWDAGVDQPLFDGALTASVTYFELDTKNLIDYDFAGDAYVQIPGTTRRNGVEAQLKYAVADWVDVAAAYTFTRAHDTSGARRPRVPKHDVVLGLFTRPAENWNTSTTVRIVHDTVDTVSGTLVPLDDYVLVNAKVGYSPMEGMELYVRGENLLDEKYQVVKGYGTKGASVYGGFEYQF
jgi:vitamin B12 transporter